MNVYVRTHININLAKQRPPSFGELCPAGSVPQVLLHMSLRDAYHVTTLIRPRWSVALCQATTLRTNKGYTPEYTTHTLSFTLWVYESHIMLNPFSNGRRFHIYSAYHLSILYSFMWD